jgi:nucleoside-diphosphate-sugar epimerase
MAERFLVTGILGCIGAWTARVLLRDGAEVVGYDLGESRHRLELVLEPDELARVDVVRGDITDLAQLERTLGEREITHLVHLAALQVPFCRENPPLGAAVNVVGTVNVFEAVKRRRERLRHVVYVSSAAVFGAADAGAEDERTRPDTHYGVYKVANEGNARVYWQDDRLPSFALRPYTVYGPGRDQGVTSTPTQAMLAAVRGEEFRIPYGGRTPMQHAEDVARVLVAAARADLDGMHVFNMGGAVEMDDVVAAIEAAAPEARGKITHADDRLPFPEELATSGRLEALLGPAAPQPKPLADGVRETIEHFRRTLAATPA